MDTTRFDELIAGFAQSPTRRSVLRLLGAATFGAGGLALLDDAEAKKRRKKKKKKGSGSGSTCKNGKKDGSETDVDCGGKCKRCANDKTCKTRNDCVSALCMNSTCEACVTALECGEDADGMCACREVSTGLRVCTKISAERTALTGTCASVCRSGEHCVILPDEGGIECNLPCGA